MTLSQPLKIIIGVLTVFVMLFPFFIPVFMFGWVFSLSQPFSELPGNPEFNEMTHMMLPMMLYLLAIMGYSFTQLGLQVFYIIHQIKNSSLLETHRILFVLGTFFLPFVAMPIYYLLHLWKDPPAEAAAPPARDKGI